MPDSELSKERFTQLKAIACIGVVVGHAIGNYSNLFRWLACGFLWVGVFFFISGYGFMHSLLHKKTYLDNLINKKFSAVYVPFVFAEVIYMIVDGQFSSLGIGEAAIKISGIQLANPVLWYIIEIIWFWLLSVLLLKVLRLELKTYIKVMVIAYFIFVCVCVILDFGTWWYLSTSCLILGLSWIMIRKKVTLILQHRSVKFGLILLITLGFITQYTIYIQQSPILGLPENYIVTGIQMLIIPIFSLLFVLYWPDIRNENAKEVLERVGGITRSVSLPHGCYQAFRLFVATA